MLKNILLPAALAFLVGCGACVHAPPPQMGFIRPPAVTTQVRSVEQRSKTYSHDGPNGKIAIIEFTSGIDEESANEFLANMASVPSDALEIVVLLDSPGGYVHSTRSMIRAVESARVPVVCLVDGIAASGAMLFLQSCDIRVMTHRSSLMIHNASYQRPEGRSDQESLEEELHSIRTTNDQIAWQYCHRLQMTYDRCRESYRDHDWWMTENEALGIQAADMAVTNLAELLSVLDEATTKNSQKAVYSR